MKFRNKPIEIEAYQLTEDLIRSIVLDGLNVPGLRKMRSSCHPERREVYSSKFTVITIHGQETVVVVGDWIITEPDGEHHYPCKPDIFAARYEPLLPTPQESE
jgi:hypothetical protein